MLTGPVGTGSISLMNVYSLRLGDALLRSRMREAEQTARLEGEIASRVKSEFISNMSHELRTPLNTVIGFSKLLSEHEKRQLKAQDVSEYARLIQDAAGHLLSLINDILDISKLQSGRYNLDSHDIDLEDILTAVMSSLSKAATAAGVTVTDKIAFDLPPMRGDGGKLAQAFSNIISNAIKFTRNGGSVVVAVAARGTDGAEISIRDTGVGMEETEIEIAMTPFGQVDGGKSRWREGAGLGLPIASALVRLHGGTIGIQSTKGLGTEVTIFLPSAARRSTGEQESLVLGVSGLPQTVNV